MEQRLNVAPWQVQPNENNSVLARGATKLGVDWHVIPRNVSGCWNLGYCGTGCPTNAKQSMLVTTLPAALDKGAVLVAIHKAKYFKRGDGLAIGPGTRARVLSIGLYGTRTALTSQNKGQTTLPDKGFWDTFK